MSVIDCSHTINKPDGTIIGIDLAEGDGLETWCQVKLDKDCYRVLRVFTVYTNRKQIK